MTYNKKVNFNLLNNPNKKKKKIHTKKTIMNNSNADMMTANRKSIASPGIIFIFNVQEFL